MDLKVYFFSGTGNAKHCAEWISEEFKLKGLPAEVINIEEMEKRKNVETDSDIIGFCYPTHGFNLPPVMMNFILRFPSGAGESVFLLNTRAGTKAGRFLLPGLSGIALLFSAVVLKCKGYKVVGMRSVDLPSNWTAAHIGLKESKVDTIYNVRKREVLEFASILSEKRSSFKSLKDILQDILISPVALIYFLIGRFFLAKTLVADRSCSRCNLCVKMCPVSAIEIIDERPYWTWKCESCMRCMNICPERSVQATHGFVIFMILILNFFVLKGLNGIAVFDGASPIVRFVINNLFFISGMFAGYGILHWLMKIPFVEKLVTATSLTSYKFWKRYKAPE